MCVHVVGRILVKFFFLPQIKQSMGPRLMCYQMMSNT